MAKNRGRDLLGSWSFLIGVVLAVVLGTGLLGAYNVTITWVLVLIGLVVGLLNITGKEVQPFLISGTVLIIASSLGTSGLSSVPSAGTILEGILGALLLVFVPATIIVALKNVFSLARN